MRQCLSGGDKERSAMLASKECQGALEVLQDSPLYDCRCKRGMKKELQCLQNYWSIHMGLTEVLWCVCVRVSQDCVAFVYLRTVLRSCAGVQIHTDNEGRDAREHVGMNKKGQTAEADESAVPVDLHPGSQQLSLKYTHMWLFVKHFVCFKECDINKTYMVTLTDAVLGIYREEFYETSPYEPIHFSEEFRHASIISDSSLSKMSPCSEAGKPCNPCLDAAKACNLNETCKRLRSAYNSVCSKATPPQPSVANQEPCSRKRCQKALRQFFERVSWELSYPLLFCSCPDQACAERRRRTIVPSCSHQERHKPTCLELRRTCRSDALCRASATLRENRRAKQSDKNNQSSIFTQPLWILQDIHTGNAEIVSQTTVLHLFDMTLTDLFLLCRFRSRLADFHMNCQMTSHTVTSCPHDNYHGCLMSYVGLIGSDVTPNYSDSSPSNITISLWCTCRGTGHQEPECDAFHRDFTHNTCLILDSWHKKKNAIKSFGYGSEGGTLLVTEPSSTFLPPAQPPIISKPAPSLHGNAIKPMDSACMFSTCANLQDGGQKCVPSDEFECEEALLAQGSIDSQDSAGPKSSSRQSAPLHHISVTVCVSILPAFLLFVS
ncbi:hypothetical protein L3Q82_012794 [Scortum barcoo]|uniref:Uncharacterized protein n=1 Tax=Scortum barcoo TaxID=214431 RepID=A0ACB8W3D7_9TELE|nr:hypothetical protein L3Q82_012794 [Scortum barcoo]